MVRNQNEPFRSLICFSLVVILLSSSAVFFQSNAQGEPRIDSVISTTNTESEEVSIALGPNRFVVWTQQNADNQQSDIFFRRSTDNGATWKPAFNLSTNAGLSFAPQIAVSGGNVFVVWQDISSGNYEILLRRSSDDGATWKSTINLSSNPGDSDAPRVVASGSNIYVVWTQNNAEHTSTDVIFRRSVDNGVTWKPKVNLSNNGASGYNPEMAVSGSNVYIVWPDRSTIDGGGIFRRSTDNGATWESKINLHNFGDPQIAASGEKVYVVWAQGHETFFKRSTDNGATWKSQVNLSNSADSDDEFPELAVSGNSVYVAWVATEMISTGDSTMLIRRSTDNGATWKSVVPLSSSDDAANPRITLAGSNVYAVWQDQEPGVAEGPEIFFRRSTDGGATWKSIVNLSNNDGESRVPQIVGFGNNVYVVWADDSPAGNLETFFKRSTDNGATWKAVKNLSNNVGGSEEQQIAV